MELFVNFVIPFPVYRAALRAFKGFSGPTNRSLHIVRITLTSHFTSLIPKGSSIIMPRIPKYVIRQSSDRGIGMFAMKDLRTGELICSEPILLESEKTTPIEIYAQYHQLCEGGSYGARQYRGLSHVGHLPPLPSGTKVPDLDDEIRQNQVTRLDAYLNSLERANKRRVPPFTYMIRDTASRVVAIFENNCFRIRNKNDTAEAWAVFMKASRLNHSCVPNCYASWNKSLVNLCVYAIREITKGEELTIAYDTEEHFFDCFEERHSRLQMKYGFNCSCTACALLKATTGEFSDNEWKRKWIADRTKRITELTAAGREDTEEVDNLRTEMLQLKAEQGLGTWESGKA